MSRIIRRFQNLSLAAVSDALDMVGFPGQCRGIKPLSRDFRVAGRIFTVAYAPADQTTPGQTVGDYIEDVPGDHIVLIANQGREDCTVWGDILTLAANLGGVQGTVIDGVCRDSDYALEQRYPLFAKGSFMRTGKGRAALHSSQQPVQFCGVFVAPGDLVIGAADGVVIVPARLEQKVLNIAEDIEVTENNIRTALLDGARLKDARAQFGYHAIAPKDGHG